jgi:hypothetical protein
MKTRSGGPERVENGMTVFTNFAGRTSHLNVALGASTGDTREAASEG